jgi:hypothetical protein
MDNFLTGAKYLSFYLEEPLKCATPATEDYKIIPRNSGNIRTMNFSNN